MHAGSIQQKNENWTGGGAGEMMWLTTRTVASSNYMPDESKKAERSTTSVDLLVVEAIWTDQQSEVDWLTIAKIAERWLQNMLKSEEWQQHSVPAKFRRQW